MIIGSLLHTYHNFSLARRLKSAQKIVKQVNSLEEKMRSASDDDLQNFIKNFKLQVAEGRALTDFLIETFAIVREAAQRTVGMRHFNVQLIGGYVLHLGAIAEMKTGEGKTLVATLPAVLNALSGKGVHVITVNDYLTRRDWEFTRDIYDFLGLTSSYIIGGTSSKERKERYQHDITYITNSEAVFDYLRDNTQTDLEFMVQRGHNFAIFDEVDFGLIDEARSPIILAGPSNKNSQVYKIIDQLIRGLKETDFEKDEKTKHVTLTADGSLNIERTLQKMTIIKGGLYDLEHAYINHFITQSLHAHHMLHKNVDYIVKEGQVCIIDEFTGRIMDGRRYSDGLHQAVEAKEQVKVQNENQTLASISLQNYAKLYQKISGMTGTAATEAKEFQEIYNLEVFVIPTNKKVIRVDHNDAIYNTIQEKNEAILDLIKECHEQGQPVLVGTISIEKSEELSKMLTKNKIQHNILNAKHHDKEAKIIAQAGQPGAVTIATNMAGRGTDIKLGGNLEMLLAEFAAEYKHKPDSEYYLNYKKELQQKIQEDEQKVLEAGGLYVIGTERHESRRIDNQLRGRSGRQGNTGASKFFISLDDSLMRLFGSQRIQKILATMGLKKGEAIDHPMINKSIEKAQKKIENHHYETRKNLIKFDDTINKQRKIIFALRLKIMNNGPEIIVDFQQIWQYLNEKMVEEYIENGNDSEIKQKLLDLYKVSDIDEIFLQKNNIKNKLHEKILEIYQQKIFSMQEADMVKILKKIWLMIIDSQWCEHINNVEYLKQGINLRSLGQKDPLIEFQREVFELFDEAFTRINIGIIRLFFKI